MIWESSIRHRETYLHREIEAVLHGEVPACQEAERAMIKNIIEGKGLNYTWDKVLEMRVRVDSVEAVKAKQK